MNAVLEAVDVSARYGSASILHDVSVQVGRGEIVCVLGRNGAGRTTLLRALMGVVPKSGAVRLDGVDITGLRASRINRAGMVWVPQDDGVFPGLTVREHLSIALHDRDRNAGIAAAATLFPILGERLGQEAQTLSGGERKMLGIAQAMIVEPNVVLMDEPTEGVAPVVVADLIPAIRTLAERSAVLLVEQNLDTVLALSSRGYVLEMGRIVEEGSLEALYEDGTLERRLAL
jgi:branched-chain amino acid transport system ATP-binding protein